MKRFFILCDRLNDGLEYGYFFLIYFILCNRDNKYRVQELYN
jgi:hypothetical protein